VNLLRLKRDFYSQCASCPIAAGSAGCALSELEDGNYIFEGETPHGGVVAMFYFRDNEGNQVKKVMPSMWKSMSWTRVAT